MKFLCDVHISYKLVSFLSSCGFEAIHVNTILDKWRTKDSDICKYADDNNFIVITKDQDFKYTFFVNQSPKKLIKINLGNVANHELISLFSNNIKLFEELYTSSRFMFEIDQNRILITDGTSLTSA